MKQIRLNIDGMTCEHCSKRVHDALAGVDGVQSCDVQLDAKRADVVMNDGVEISTLSGAVTDAGYRLSGFSPIDGKAL